MPELLEEVERLPERYRAPIVLCYLEGQSQEQAALVLGCPIRTVQTRLQRGKARLRTRLVRRGLAPAAGLLAMGVESAESATSLLAGSVPATLAETTARASVQFAATRAAGLATAAIGLAHGVLESLYWNRLRRAGLGFGLFAGLALAVLAIAAAGQKSEKPPATIGGTIFDDQGRPIPDAEVWMPIGFDEQPETTPHSTTDARGHYDLPVPEAWARLPLHQKSVVVWSYAPGHQINAANAHAALHGEARSVNLTLGPATDTSFVVYGPDGRTLAGAVVEPLHFKTPRAYDLVPKAMMPSIRAVTDAAGRAQLPALPREGFFSVKVTVGSLGAQQLRLKDQATEPARREIRLRAAGRIEGRVIADRREWAAGLKVYATTTDASEAPGGYNLKTQGEEVVTTRPDGSFVIPAIAAGKVNIATRVDEALPVRPMVPEGLDVRIDETTRVEIPLKAAVRLRGVIRVRGTGEPVPGASISVSYPWGATKGAIGGPAGSSMAVSDAKGRYETYGLPGDVGMHVIAMPGNCVQMGQPWAERYPVPDGATTFDLPPIEVVKGITIKGRLVGAGDRPVANANVSALSGNRRYGYARTDRDGAFTLMSIPGNESLGYEVSLTDHEPQVAAEIVEKEPLLLRANVGKRPGPTATVSATLSGTVVDADGRPVEGVEVNLVIQTANTQMRRTMTTNAQGVYRDAHPIEKGTKYRGIASPGKYAIAASEVVTAEGADQVTLPPIIVTRLLRTIAGRVVDTEGRPVSGARVLNWGNPAPLTGAVTGRSGRFQLDGFPRERALLFVDAPGFRFQRATPDPGKSTTELTLRRDDQPPERGVGSLGPPIPRERAIKLAGAVLKPYAERIIKPGTDPDARSRALQVAAQIDPDNAWRRCQAGEEPWDSDAVRVAAVRHLAASRPDEAEAIIPAIKNDFWRQSVRIELADALSRDAIDRKLALLGDVGNEAQGSDGRLMTYHLGRATRRLIDLGRGDQARRLLDEFLPRAGRPTPPTRTPAR